jgi:signal transduction histidine kinase
MTSVQLLVADEGNRRALADLLEGRYDVVTDRTLRDADLHVVDDRSLPEYRDALVDRKRDRHPMFCPVVLIRREDTDIRIELPDPGEVDGPRIVNEIMTAPVERSVLFRRLTNLLVRREHTQELVETTERLDRFASMASHELRNPLGILEAYLPLARKRGDPEHFDQCEQAIDRMNRQIDDFLTLARKGTDPVELQPVDVAQAAEDCWEMVEVPSADLGIEIDCRIRADTDKLLAVLENLFRNAVEHTDGDVAVKIGSIDSRSEERDEEGDPHGFYVEDDGSGIPADEHEIVFEDGYSTSQHGTGFGLTIIDRITESHDWEISICEGRAGGARFEITGVECAECAAEES